MSAAGADARRCTRSPRGARQWYREPYVWLVLLFPALAVCSGVVTLTLAVHSDDGLVVDDYYRRGKEINRVLQRDRAAAALGLQAQLTLAPERGVVEVEIAAAVVGYRPPPALHLTLAYATRAGHDVTLALARSGDGVYRVGLPRLREGRWHVHLQAQDWRLTGVLSAPAMRRLSLSAAQ